MCPVCQDIYKSPKINTCGHSFCATCGEKLQNCPICGKEVQTFVTNFLAETLLGAICEEQKSEKLRMKYETTERARPVKAIFEKNLTDSLLGYEGYLSDLDKHKEQVLAKEKPEEGERIETQFNIVISELVQAYDIAME